MRECQQCGEANQPSSRFCVVCGTPIAAAPGGLPSSPPPVAARPALPTPAPARLDASPARSHAAPAPVAIAAPVVVSQLPAPPNAAPIAVPPIALAPAAPAPGAPAPNSPVAGGTGRPGPHAAGANANRDLGADFPLDGPRTLVGFLVSYENVEEGQYWPIHQGRSVLGRQGAATGLDLEVSHPTTSSLHAVLLAAAHPGRIVIEDTSSTNGTFVNDNMLASGQRWELRDGDRLRFGLFDAVIKIIDRT